MICHDFAVTLEEVHTEVITTPSDCQWLIFDLRVVPFHTREGFASVGDHFPTLSEHATQSNRSSICGIYA